MVGWLRLRLRLAGRAVRGLIETADVYAGLDFGDRAVVDLDLDRLALDEDALYCISASGNQKTLGGGGRVGAHGDRNLRGGVAAIGHADGHQPVAGAFRAGKDALDAQVGQAFVRIDPIQKEPGQVAARGLIEELFERTAAGIGAGWIVEIVAAECGSKGGVAGEIPQHPQHIRGLGAVIDRRRSLS